MDRAHRRRKPDVIVVRQDLRIEQLRNDLEAHLDGLDLVERLDHSQSCDVR